MAPSIVETETHPQPSMGKNRNKTPKKNNPISASKVGRGGGKGGKGGCRAPKPNGDEAALTRARNAEASALADAEAERIAEEKEKFELTKEEKKRATAEARMEKQKQTELRQATNAKNAEEKKRLAVQKAMDEYKKAKAKSAEKADIASKHIPDAPPVAASTKHTISVRGGKKIKGSKGAVEQMKEVEVVVGGTHSPDRRKHGSNKRFNPRSPNRTPCGH